MHGCMHESPAPWCHPTGCCRSLLHPASHCRPWSHPALHPIAPAEKPQPLPIVLHHPAASPRCAMHAILPMHSDQATFHLSAVHSDTMQISRTPPIIQHPPNIQETAPHQQKSYFIHAAGSSPCHRRPCNLPKHHLAPCPGRSCMHTSPCMPPAAASSCSITTSSLGSAERCSPLQPFAHHDLLPLPATQANNSRRSLHAPSRRLLPGIHSSTGVCRQGLGGCMHGRRWHLAGAREVDIHSR